MVSGKIQPSPAGKRTVACHRVAVLSKTLHLLDGNFFRRNRRGERMGAVGGRGRSYFCRTVAPILFVGQLFGLLPVAGVRGGRWWCLRWRALSPRNGYALAVQLGALMLAGFSFATFWASGVEFAKIMSCTFFLLNLLTSVNFSLLARRWPGLMGRWVLLEQSLPDQPRLSASYRRYARRLRVIATILLASGLIEHVLSKPAGLHRAYRCPIPNLLEALYRQAFPELFSFVPYDAGVGLVAQTITSLLTVYWNYVDLFLIVVSVGLRANLHHLREFLGASVALYHRRSFWEDQCAAYRRVVGLIRLINDHIGPFILISYSSNLFFICIQLVNVFQQQTSLVVRTYFWYSLLHLIGRLLAVSLYGSAIHDEYCRVRSLLYNLPVEFGYREEVRRFQRQVERDPVSLTGYGFFHLTRKLILKACALRIPTASVEKIVTNVSYPIAATVVTYELVLTQVNEAEAKNGDDNPCT